MSDPPSVGAVRPPPTRRGGRSARLWARARRGVVGSADDLDAHAPGGALDLAGSRLKVVGIEIGELDRRDLADLITGHAPGGLAFGRRAALVDPGRLAEQVGRGRRLEDERERAVLEDRDLGGDDLTGLVGRLLVVRLREFDDVDAVRT